MAESTICKTKRDGEIVIFDLGETNSYTVSFEAGDLSVTIPGRTVSLFLDRGVMASPPCLRYGDDQPLTGSFSAILRDLTDAAVETLNDILMQSGFVAANWVSTLGANSEVFTVGIRFNLKGTDHGDATDHTATFAYCNLTGALSEGDPSSLAVSFTDYELYPTLT